MLETFRRAFQTKDIRRKLGYTFLMLIVIRLGSQLPTPGVDPTYIKEFFAQNSGEAFNLFNAFTGGSFEQMSILALSITPYITSSIIVQLLTIAIPKLEEMQKDGEDGRKKIVAITRYLTVGLALMESTAMAVGFGRQGLLKEFNFVNAAIVVLTLIWGDPVAGWPSLVCILFGVGGVQLLCTGILGQYLAKTYLEVKNRPVYLLKDSSKEEQRIMMMPLSQNMRRKSYGKGKEVHSV